MESKEYFEKLMQDYNQNRKGRSLRKYCKDEAVDYDWLIQFITIQTADGLFVKKGGLDYAGMKDLVSRLEGL